MPQCWTLARHEPPVFPDASLMLDLMVQEIVCYLFMTVPFRYESLLKIAAFNIDRRTVYLHSFSKECRSALLTAKLDTIQYGSFIERRYNDRFISVLGLTMARTGQRTRNHPVNLPVTTVLQSIYWIIDQHGQQQHHSLLHIKCFIRTQMPCS
jgi:hypothetical protein